MTNILDAGAEECRKIDERVAKFRDKFLFVEELKARPKRRSKMVK